MIKDSTDGDVDAQNHQWDPRGKKKAAKGSREGDSAESSTNFFGACKHDRNNRDHAHPWRSDPPLLTLVRHRMRYIGWSFATFVFALICITFFIVGTMKYEHHGFGDWFEPTMRPLFIAISVAAAILTAKCLSNLPRIRIVRTTKPPC